MTREELGIEAREAHLSRLREERKYQAELFDVASTKSDRNESFINLKKNEVEMGKFENASPEEAFDILVAEERQQSESRIAKYEELLRTETNPNKLNSIQESLQEEYKIRSMSDEEIVTAIVETDNEMTEWNNAAWKSEKLLTKLGIMKGKQRDSFYFEGLYEPYVMKHVSEEQISQLAEDIKASGKIEEFKKNDRRKNFLDIVDSVVGDKLSEKLGIDKKLDEAYEKMTIDLREFVQIPENPESVENEQNAPNGSDGMDDDSALM